MNMIEFKVGPTSANSTMGAFKFLFGSYLKSILLVLLVFVLTYLPSSLTSLIREKENEPGSTLVFACLFFVSIAFISLIFFRRATKIAYWFVKFNDDAVTIECQKGTPSTVERISYNNIRNIVVTKNYLFSSNILPSETPHGIWIRYHAHNLFGLDSLKFLGFQPKDQMLKVAEILKEKHPAIEIVVD